MTFNPIYDLHIKFCNIFRQLKPGSIKCRFRIENRSGSLADSTGETPYCEIPSGANWCGTEIILMYFLDCQFCNICAHSRCGLSVKFGIGLLIIIYHLSHFITMLVTHSMLSFKLIRPVPRRQSYSEICLHLCCPLASHFGAGKGGRYHDLDPWRCSYELRKSIQCLL